MGRLASIRGPVSSPASQHSDTRGSEQKIQAEETAAGMSCLQVGLQFFGIILNIGIPSQALICTLLSPSQRSTIAAMLVTE